MKDEDIVIIGNGGAAISAAKAARIAGYKGKIHILSDTDTPAFNPMLSPYYLKGIIPWENCFPFGDGFYRDYEITCHFDEPAENLDIFNKQVITAKGKRLSFDRCLIATGASPIFPPITGLRNSHLCVPLRSAESVKGIERASFSAQRAIVLGASLVGIKVAEILRKKGIHVILADVEDQILPRGAHPLSAAILRKYFENNGIDVRLGCTMENVENKADGTVCMFSDNLMEDVDFVAVCTGVRPNLGFLDGQTVEIDQAVLVDERMRTNRQDIFAAGDVSQGLNILSGKQEWLGTWGNACFQGRVAGYNMAGRDVLYQGGIPHNISPFFKWTYAQLGDVQQSRESVRFITFGDPEQGGHFVLAFENGILIGANLINCTYLAGKIKRAIILRQDWGQYLDQPDKYLTPHGIERILNRTTFDHKLLY